MNKPTDKPSSACDSDLDIFCCPICSSDEFLLSSDQKEIICVDCGVVTLEPKSRIHRISEFSHAYTVCVLH
ncbi:hypothetical protein FM109_02635 [Vibrio casei]|nr:hypothetical protein FM109_02635 [Vibrio casei]